MKNENKTTRVLILIFPGKNALWNHRKSLKNGSAKLFVSLRKFNHICRPSFYTENGYKKEICKFLGYEWIRIRNIAHKNLFFFGYYIHPHQKLLTKKKRVLFVDGSFNFSLFSRVLWGKKQLPIPFPWSFWLDMWKCTTKQQFLHIKTRLQSIGTLNSRSKENLQLYKKLAKKRFLN